jgi:hypothetical protein
MRCQQRDVHCIPCCPPRSILCNGIYGKEAKNGLSVSSVTGHASHAWITRPADELMRTSSAPHILPSFSHVTVRGCGVDEELQRTVRRTLRVQGVRILCGG